MPNRRYVQISVTPDKIPEVNKRYEIDFTLISVTVNIFIDATKNRFYPTFDLQRPPKYKTHWFVENWKIALEVSVLSLCWHNQNMKQRSNYGLLKCTIRSGLGLKAASEKASLYCYCELPFRGLLRLFRGWGRVSFNDKKPKAYYNIKSNFGQNWGHSLWLREATSRISYSY